MRREKANYVIQSVAHALEVLEQFRGDQDELGVTELSKRLKLHKNNVFRLLATLESRGYIEQNKSTENYRLGVRCLQIGQRYILQMGLLQQARPILEYLAQACRETARVAVFRSGGMVSVAAVEAVHPVRLAADIGALYPLHCTAVGKAHLAFAPEKEIDEQLPEPLPPRTAKTITDRPALLQQLKRIADQGYAVDMGEDIEDVRSVAVPVRDYTRSVVACLAVSGPAYRLTGDHIDKVIVPAVLQAGKQLSARLGFNP